MRLGFFPSFVSHSPSLSIDLLKVMELWSTTAVPPPAISAKSSISAFVETPI